MATPRIYADFHNADSSGRLRLNCIGTMEDLAAHKIALAEGLHLQFFADDVDDNGQLDELEVDGVVSFSEEEHCWVATIDWVAIQHHLDVMRAIRNGEHGSPAVSPTGDSDGRKIGAS